MTESRVRILVVDEELPIRRYLKSALTAHGYDVLEAATGEAAVQMVVKARPDLVILDLGLPDLDGVEVIRRLREWTRLLPVIVLSVREHERDKVAALDAGADDYLTKPFSTGELLARLRASLRRAVQISEEPVFTLGNLTVDLAHRLVICDEESVQLTPTEYDLLRVLVTHAGKVITHRHLLTAVWGQGYENAVHLLRVNISNLRHKLESDPTRPCYIVTEPGVGYRLRDSL
jgi:two-component system, OmpR family, KDP operon response regulator KdpE